MNVWYWESTQEFAYLFRPTEQVVMRKVSRLPIPPRAICSVGRSALTDTHKKRSGGEMPSCLSVASSFKRTYSLETAVSAPCHVKQATTGTLERPNPSSKPSDKRGNGTGNTAMRRRMTDVDSDGQIALKLGRNLSVSCSRQN